MRRQSPTDEVGVLVVVGTGGGSWAGGEGGVEGRRWRHILILRAAILAMVLVAGGGGAAEGAAPGGLLGHWPLRGDCRDLSGLGNHGRALGEGTARGAFDGRRDSIEVPAGPSLRFGVGDFSLCAWVWTAPDIDDVLGDVLSKYDPVRRRGFHLSLGSSAGGYNSHGDDRHVFFGIDDGRPAEWEDCGRPSATSNYISNSLTVFDGSLYAAITDAAREEDWCHVFRYKGGLYVTAEDGRCYIHAGARRRMRA